MTSMENLPGEVLSNIFIRLLAKQLAQMRSVCKYWNALLSDSSFIKSHLNHSVHNNVEILLFFDLMFSLGLTPTPCPTPFTVCLSCSPDLELTNLIKPMVIPQPKYGWGALTGSVNGLICFVSESSLGGFVLLHIWNPSLSAILTLPPLPWSSRRIHFGFGYDPKSDDYKIVKLTGFSRAPNQVKKAEVYSIRKDSWQLISPQTFPSHITICEGFYNQVCVDDNLHWLCHTQLESKPQTIVGFDLGAETFNEIHLPDYKVYKRSNVIGVLSGKLCVISRVIDGGKWEVWVMEEYGVFESWVKRHVFSQFSGDIAPCGFTSHVSAKTKTLKIMSRRTSEMKFVEYVDSLIWVPPPNREISGCDMSQLQIGK